MGDLSEHDVSAQLLQRPPLGPARVLTRARWHLAQGYVVHCPPDSLIKVRDVSVRNGVLNGQHKCLVRQTHSEQLPLESDHCGGVLDADPFAAAEGLGGNTNINSHILPVGKPTNTSQPQQQQQQQQQQRQRRPRVVRRASQPVLLLPSSSLFDHSYPGREAEQQRLSSPSSSSSSSSSSVTARAQQQQKMARGPELFRARATSLPSGLGLPQPAAVGGHRTSTRSANVHEHVGVGISDHGRPTVSTPSLFDFDPRERLNSKMFGGNATTPPRSSSADETETLNRTVRKGMGDAGTPASAAAAGTLASATPTSRPRRGSLLDHLSPSLRFASILLASQVKKSTAKTVKDRFLGEVGGEHPELPSHQMVSGPTPDSGEEVVGANTTEPGQLQSASLEGSGVNEAAMNVNHSGGSEVHDADNKTQTRELFASMRPGLLPGRDGPSPADRTDAHSATYAGAASTVEERFQQILRAQRGKADQSATSTASTNAATGDIGRATNDGNDEEFPSDQNVETANSEGEDEDRSAESSFDDGDVEMPSLMAPLVEDEELVHEGRRDSWADRPAEQLSIDHPEIDSAE